MNCANRIRVFLFLPLSNGSLPARSLSQPSSNTDSVQSSDIDFFFCVDRVRRHALASGLMGCFYKVWVESCTGTVISWPAQLIFAWWEKWGLREQEMWKESAGARKEGNEIVKERERQRRGHRLLKTKGISEVKAIIYCLPLKRIWSNQRRTVRIVCMSLLKLAGSAIISSSSTWCPQSALVTGRYFDPKDHKIRLQN